MLQVQRAVRKPTRSAVRLDRRATIRYPCHLKSTCQPLTADENAGWTGEVLNISAGGLGLLVAHAFKPRDLLIVEMPRGQESRTRGLLARVVHVRKKDEGKYLIGCAFASLLREQELQAILDET